MVWRKGMVRRSIIGSKGDTLLPKLPRIWSSDSLLQVNYILLLDRSHIETGVILRWMSSNSRRRGWCEGNLDLRYDACKFRLIA